MISGAHAIVYSTDPDGVRAFLRDVLELPGIDAGDGWPVFALPPAEIAVHPVERGSSHELYLMCDDIEATVADLRRKDVQIDGDIVDAGWGRRITVRLPDGSPLSIYEPRHATTTANRR